jgi:hypothetical protein
MQPPTARWRAPPPLVSHLILVTGHQSRIRKTIVTWSPVTESNRRPSPYHKHGPMHTECLAALMTRVIALMTLAVLGLPGAPCHAGRRRAVPRGRRRAVPRATRRAVRPGRTVITYACAGARIAGSPGRRPCRPWAAAGAAGRCCRVLRLIGDCFRGLAAGRTMADRSGQSVIS